MPAYNCTSSIECDFGEIIWALETEEGKWKPTGFVFVFSLVMLLPFWHQHSQLAKDWKTRICKMSGLSMAVGFALIKLLTLKKYKTLFRKAILKFNNQIRYIVTYILLLITTTASLACFLQKKNMQHGPTPTSFSETKENVAGRSWREPNNTVVGSFCLNLIFTTLNCSFYIYAGGWNGG